MTVQDIKKRFYVSLILTIPVFVISPTVQGFFGLRDYLKFNGDVYILFILSTVTYIYGGWPFLTGFIDEIKKFKPGMRTLVAMAISVAYFYSSAVVFGFYGKMFFWELASLVDIMLLGRWIEMRSIHVTSNVLAELEKLMSPTTIEIIRNAQKSKSKVQSLADKAAEWLAIAAIIAGILTVIIWTAAEHKSLNFALIRAVTVIIIACPHTLGLAVPLVVAASTNIAVRNGFIIRNRNAFEAARNINVVVLDKNIVLTKGELGISDIVLLNNEMEKSEELKYSAFIKENIKHTFADLTEEKSNGSFQEKAEMHFHRNGEIRIIKGHSVKILSPDYILESKTNTGKKDKIAKLIDQGKIIKYLLINEKTIAAVAFAEVVSKEAMIATKELKKMGIRTIILTGESRNAAIWAANMLEADEYYAEVLPEETAEKIKEIQSRNLKVAMAGDGINDAPALAQADLGIAVAYGDEITIETADVILKNSNPKDIAAMIKFSKTVYKKMAQNLLWAAGYNIITIPLAAGILYSKGILLDPAIAAVLTTLSMGIVAINTKLLKFEKQRNDRLYNSKEI